MSTKVSDSKYLVICISGPYANENEEDIFKRKEIECEGAGFTFWHHQSHQAQPQHVQDFYRQAVSQGDTPLFLVVSSASGKGGKNTKPSTKALNYLENENGSLKPIPSEIHVQKGDRPWALKIRNFRTYNGQLDLGQYSMLKISHNQQKVDAQIRTAVKTIIGASTVMIVKSPPSDDSVPMKRRERTIFAFGELIEPYSVWLR